MHHSIRQPESKWKMVWFRKCDNFQCEYTSLVLNNISFLLLVADFFCTCNATYLSRSFSRRNCLTFMQINVVFRRGIQAFSDIYVLFTPWFFHFVVILRSIFRKIRKWTWRKVVSSHRYETWMHVGKKSTKSPTYINIHWATADKMNLWIQFQYAFSR